MSALARRLAAAVSEENRIRPSTNSIESQSVYSVPLGTAPGSISFSTTLTRLVVKFDTGSSGLATMPAKITIPYKKIGNPTGFLRVGIRKSAGDTFQLMQEWPINGDYTVKQGWINVDVRGANEYQMLANDKVSLEHTPVSNDDTIAMAVSTTQGNPSGFTSQQYTGSYANTTNPLAVNIVSKVLVPL